MAKMTQQAAGVGSPIAEFIREFGRWTDEQAVDLRPPGPARRGRVLARGDLRAQGAGHRPPGDRQPDEVRHRRGRLTGQKDFVDGLCAIARDTGLHIHLVCHMRKGENEKSAPGKFDVKGAGEIADLADNIVIVWKNLRKPDDIAAAEREKATEADREAALVEARKRSRQLRARG
jgi:twinkle protein